MPMSLDYVLEKNRSWASEKLALDTNYFSELSKGQAPQILYIGCSDSRCATERLLGLEPGEVFVHRNIANIIDANDASAGAVIHYAVNQLKVKHIIVCGHTECGGVKAAIDKAEVEGVSNWINPINEVLKENSDELDRLEEKARFKRAVELNALTQCQNLLSFQCVLDADVNLHAWLFNLSTGEIEDLNFNGE